MSLLFLEELGMNPDPTAGLMAVIAGMMVFFLVFAVIMWIFTSFVFMAIAKKAKYSKPGIAWIPYIGPLIVVNRISKMHWWPLLLLIGVWIPILGSLLGLVVTIFSVIWLWKTFEAIKKPGWWAILCLIPVVNIIILAIAAWSK